ncbi:MAG: NUDIX hydrolase [Patescibacteria group bacterium]|jgi:ADP-ribose pyrophosphatase YjhB (NUDIX family)
MITINSRIYKFCPYCGKALKKKIEESKARQWCTDCKWIYYPHVASAVGAIIVNDGNVLMVKRGRDPYKDTWVFPSGFVDYGEHPEETLIREVKEETGLKVVEYQYFLLLQTSDDPRSPGHFSIFYKVNNYVGSLINNDSEENKDIRWFPINHMPIIGWKSHNKVAKLLFENLSNR